MNVTEATLDVMHVAVQTLREVRATATFLRSCRDRLLNRFLFFVFGFGCVEARGTAYDADGAPAPAPASAPSGFAPARSDESAVGRMIIHDPA